MRPAYFDLLKVDAAKRQQLRALIGEPKAHPDPLLQVAHLDLYRALCEHDSHDEHYACKSCGYPTDK